MRVAFDVTVSARAATGVGVYARQLLPALQATGHDIRRWQHPLGSSGAYWQRGLNGVRLAWWLAHAAGRACTREGIDVFHATTAVGPLRTPCPVVMTVHDASTVTMPLHRGISDRLFHRAFAVHAARRASAVLCPTQAAATDVAEHYGIPAARIRVVPLGVSPAFRDVTPDAIAAVRARHGLTRPYVLYVGANTPRKNLSTLVRAMSRLSARLPDIDLVWVGPAGRNDAAIHDLAHHLQPAPVVRHLGMVPESDLPALYAASSTVAYISLFEGFGLPVAEAMAAGRPVVTSRRSAMAEVAGDAAWFVDPTDVEAVADGLEKALTDAKLASRLTTAGRLRSLQYDWAHTAALTSAVYRDVSGLRC